MHGHQQNAGHPRHRWYHDPEWRQTIIDGQLTESAGFTEWIGIVGTPAAKPTMTLGGVEILLGGALFMVIVIYLIAGRLQKPLERNWLIKQTKRDK